MLNSLDTLEDSSDINKKFKVGNNAGKLSEDEEKGALAFREKQLLQHRADVWIGESGVAKLGHKDGVFKQPEQINDLDNPISKIQEEGLFVDWFANDEIIKDRQLLSMGERTYVISPINEVSKSSASYRNCMGIIAVGKDKETEKNISFLTHQNPGYMMPYINENISEEEKKLNDEAIDVHWDLLKRMKIKAYSDNPLPTPYWRNFFDNGGTDTREESIKFLTSTRVQFEKDLSKSLKEILDRSKPGTLDISISGGQAISKKFADEYIRNIPILEKIIKDNTNIKPFIGSIPTLDKNHDTGSNIYFDTQNKYAYMIRPEESKGDKFQSNFNSTDTESVLSHVKKAKNNNVWED